MKQIQEDTIPQPKTIPVIGNIHQINADSPIASMMEIAKSYDGIFRLDFAGNKVVVLTNRSLVDEVCDEKNFEKKLHPPLLQLRNLAKDALFTAETKELNWEKAHRILMPAFGPVAIRDMFPAMYDIAEQMLTKWSRLGDGAIVDVTDNMTRLTLDTIALASFGFRFNSFYQNEMHPFVDTMVDGLAEAGLRARRPNFIQRLLWQKRNQFAADIKFMHEVSDSLIAARKQLGVNEKNRDLLDVMLSAKDPVTGEMLDDENIRHQMVTFLIAGHETTSGLLSFTIYELLKNPSILKLARAEVDRIFGDRAPKVEDISKLTYLDQILKETLRLWPTAPAFAVHSLAKETILMNQYRVKKDETLLVLIPSLHRDPKVWKEPEVFNPDRMEKYEFEALPSNSWKPFGNGVRGCIGRSFAMQEALLVLAMAIQRFEFEFENPNYKLEIKETLTLKPLDLKIRIKARGVAHFKVDSATSERPKESIQSNGSATKKADAVTPLLILYGSNSGSSESFARKIGGDAKSQGYLATVAPLDEYARKLPTDGAVIVVTASYDGQPPNNAKIFVDWISSVPEKSLLGIKFAVFGCGNRDWSRTYQAIPKQIDESIFRAGGERLIKRGEADAKGDFFGDFEDWCTPLWGAVKKSFESQSEGVQINSSKAPELSLEFVENARENIFRAHGLQMGTVNSVRELVNLSKPHARSKIHVEIELPKGFTYRSGDYLSVLGCNPKPTVARVLKRFNIEAESQVVLQGTSAHQSLLPMNRPISAHELLSNFLELSQLAGKRQIQQMADSCPCPPEKMALLLLVQSDEEYRHQILEKRVSVLDLLDRYQSCNLSFASFLQMLPELRPRQYSISSSPLRDPYHCTLTVAVVKAKAHSGAGDFLGVTSYFLSQLKPGDKLPIAIKASQQAFHLPENPKDPIIMACAGTGIAPFRGFLEERAIQKKMGVEVGEALLFFGCDHPDVDELYRDEFLEHEKLGILKRRTAFSSFPEEGVGFVQHRIWKSRVELIDFIQRGAKIYVCGEGQNMAPAVRRALIESYQVIAKTSTQEAEQWFRDLEFGHQYVEDVFS